MDSSTTVNYDHLYQYMTSFNQMDNGYIVRGQSDLEYTKQSVIPVCDQLYHTNKGKLQKMEEIDVLRNYALYIDLVPRFIDKTHQYVYLVIVKL